MIQNAMIQNAIEETQKRLDILFERKETSEVQSEIAEETERLRWLLFQQ